jgi:diacylglycerol kinase family enzyme
VSDPHHLLVANPTAQSGRAKRWVHEAMAELKRRHMSVERLDTLPAGRTVRAVRERLGQGDVDVVIYLGGDGTFHEVATAILGSQHPVPLGMLPSGTANDQGRSFGIERGEIERNVGIIADGHITHLDVGRIERIDLFGSVTDSSSFFDSCGWGLQADILAARNKQRAVVKQIPLVRDLYRDKAIYVAASLAKLLETYARMSKYAADIVIDGQRHELKGVTDVIISNTAIYAGSWVLARDSQPDDGIFELIPMQGRRDWASKALRDLAISPVWQEQLDGLGVTHSQGFAGKDFDIELFHPEKGELLAQVDGEEWVAGNRYRVSLTQGALRLITPADFVPPWRPQPAAAADD